MAQGIRLHVDQGAFSANCWLTPDAANEDLDGRGNLRDRGSAGSNATAAAMHGGGGGHDGGGKRGEPWGGGLRLYRGSGVEGARFEASLGADPTLAGNDLRRTNQDFRALQRALHAAMAQSSGYNSTSTGGGSSGDSAGAGAGLGTGSVEALDVGYRQNRCVVFRSNLLHETAPPRFKPGYRNRRINLTFMFGNSATYISGQ